METVKAVEMVRKIRDKQYEETKGMSKEGKVKKVKGHIFDI